MATNNPPKPTIYTALSLVPDVSIDDTDVPDSVTTIESWDSSIYIGTSQGEVLHYFRDDSSTNLSYILASRQRTHAKKVRPASKIIVLPCISRAIVLSVSTASVFTLPEFAPVSGIGSLRDIHDICRDYDDRSITEEPSATSDGKNVLVTVLTRASIRFVRVFPTALKAERKIDYPSALTGFQRANFAVVANASSYDLVDLENNQKIPLFEISSGGVDNEDYEDPPEPAPESTKEDTKTENTTEDATTAPTNTDTTTTTTTTTTAGTTTTTPQDPPPPNPENHKKTPRKLKPLICAVGTNEFLLTSGTKLAEPAMGLVINTEGDISRGTIAWPKYPSSIAVDYPYVATVIDSDVLFYSLHDQDLVQTISYPSPPQVFTVTAPISQAYAPLADKIRQVPLDESPSPSYSEEQKTRIEKERTQAEKLSIISSTLFVYTKESGVQCLLSSPRIFHLEKLVEQNRIDEVREEIKTIEVSTERAFIELEYLGLLVGIGCLMHGDFDTASSVWLEGSLDPRFVIYMFDRKSFQGNMWIFNGLLPFLANTMNKLKELREAAVAKPTPKKKNSKARKNKEEPSSMPSDEVVKVLEESRTYYTYFLSEWLKRRGLESIVDKKAVFYSLELASLQLHLDDSDHKKLYEFLRTEVIESVDDALTTLANRKLYYGQFVLLEKYNRTTEFVDLWKQVLDGTLKDNEFLSEKPEAAFATYLQNVCEDCDLVWKYGMWLVERNVKLGLPVLTHRSSDNPVQFDTDEILAALKKLKNPHAWRSFLKILVYERHDVSRQGDLVEILADDLTEKLAVSSDARDIVAASYNEYKALPLPKRGYVEFMHSKMGRSLQGSEEAEVTKMRLDLIRLLLNEDSAYDVRQVCTKLEAGVGRELLVAELCVVYSRLEMHDRVITLLTHSLLDFDQSVEYCQYGRLILKTGAKSSASYPHPEEAPESTQRELFTRLFDAFLEINDEATRAVYLRMLLERHGHRLDAFTVLRKTPNDWPLERVSGYLYGVLRNVTADKNASMVAKALARAENNYVSAFHKKLTTAASKQAS
ncbi:uncharacterized protein SAPINGB_P001205 [Magnusiomyces paraingens]|uniref:CNH domain-containing protein n=1 Tax=Magnusiomyces paraingens TaxID=2606893 RepID=A0A5E8B4I6_9ASCO|nr:uncharacterized protein SAPINGB_P001205 [Saprochaete ingens]VVT46421.1 unnamed protein product [Saprochaete ingens]